MSGSSSLTTVSRQRSNGFRVLVDHLLHYPLFFLDHVVVEVLIVVVTSEGLLENFLVKELHVLLD